MSATPAPYPHNLNKPMKFFLPQFFATVLGYKYYAAKNL